MNDRKLLEQVLEALELHAKQYPHMQKGYTVDAITAVRERLARPDPRNQCGETCERAKLCAVCLAEMGAQPEPQPRRIALDSEALYLRAKQKAEKEAALSCPEGNKRKRLQEELTDRYFYEYTTGLSMGRK